jgi:hypothetical protein
MSAAALRLFLDHKDRKTSDKSAATHLRTRPGGKFAIKDEDLPQLYALLAAAPGPHHILEQHSSRKAGPLLIDLDFEYADEPRFHVRQYKHTEIDKFVEAVHKAVEYAFGPQDDVEYVVFMALLRWYARYNVEGLGMVDCVKRETLAVTDELDAVGAWARGALEFKSGERTPVQVAYRRYVHDCEVAEKDSVPLEEFGKRIRRCYEVRNCRHSDEFGPCNRIISYKLKAE